jgi:hypothetical protein
MVEAVFNVALTVILVRTYGIFGAALGLAIPLLLLKVLLVPTVLCKHIGMRSSTLYLSMAPSAIFTGAYLMAYGWLVNHYFAPVSYPGMMLGAALALPLFLPIAYFQFQKNELAIIRRILPF